MSKHILLPSHHVIFEYFPEAESEEKSSEDFKSEVQEKLNKLYHETDKFFLLRDVESSEHVNWRYPLMTPFFVKEEIKDEKVMHIGSRYGELDEGFSHYAREIISIEMIKDCVLESGKRNIKCLRKLVQDKMENIKDLEDAGVYYIWTSFDSDPRMLWYLYNKGKKGTYLVGVPQQEDKLRAFLELMKEVTSSIPNCSIDYVPILFDESVDYQKKYDNDPSYNPPQYPVNAHTPFTQEPDEWNSWRTFSNQSGVMLLLKITV